MSDDPQLDDVRDWYVTGRRVHDPFNSDSNLVERFDHWLVEHDREVAMKAWGEAAQALAWCLDNGPADVAAAYVVKNNPYSAPVDAGARS